MSLALLTGAGLFVRGAAKAAHAEPGFGLDQSVLVDVDAQMIGYNETKGRDMYRRLLERVRTVPGVASASLASVVPFGSMTVGRRVTKLGDHGDQGTPGEEDDTSVSMGGNASAPADRGNAVGVNYYVVGADYLHTLGIRLLRGREFNVEEEQSLAGASRAIIDDTLSKKLFPKGDAVGQYVRFTDSVRASEGRATAELPMEIIGVAAPIQHNLLDTAPRPQVYVPFGRNYQANMFIHVKAAQAGSEAAVMRDVRRELRAVDDRLPVLALETMKEFRDTSPSVRIVKTGADLFGAIGLSAMVLALIGLYGVKSYLVARRTREIGIRMSLGATPRAVMWLIIRDALVLIATGLVIGVGLSLLVSSVLRSALYEVKALDPVTYVAAPLLLAAAALLACYFPARRAMKITPLKALRSE